MRDANNYQSQAATYFGDCPAAVTAAGAAPYSTKGLAGVVQAFSTQCTQGKQPGVEILAQAQPHRPFAFNGGLLAGASHNTLRIKQRFRGEEAPLLDGLNLDGRLHPLGGLYLDVLLPGRRWAGHSEAAFSTFGRRGNFPLAGGEGSYKWHGTKLDARLGARYMLKQSLTQELFGGVGFNFNFTTSYESHEQYGAGSSRLTARGVRVPTQAPFCGAFTFQAAPYIEVGARRGRFTLSVDAGLNGRVYYQDPLAVFYSSSFGAVGETTDYRGYRYSSSLLAYRAVLAFRLGHRPDQWPSR
ncbi:hypothetical protein ACFQT0_05890 [Hymenobacter humi]|uniref:Uncharacterized protein n=1 Tax=Hymenobacter humi TaxID=1411620 RepID=A0ABW2U238_9BACT